MVGRSPYLEDVETPNFNSFEVGYGGEFPRPMDEYSHEDWNWCEICHL